MNFADRVIAWQRSHGRHNLPWQGSRDPYCVWLSEIMLQQTQVATVLGYYARFLERFPNVAALAAAPQDDVLALWSGLGYYSRARNLHRCAQKVVADHAGEFPRTSQALATLPGIGRSTAAAIAAFCFGERVAIMDGNVKRVLARVLAFEADLAQTAAQNRLWDAATELLPNAGIESYTQGLMDLGATICSARAPSCQRCPVQNDCRAFEHEAQERYPIKSRKLKRGKREHLWLWLNWQSQLFLLQRPQTGVWAGLWSLPEFESTEAFERLAAQWPGQSHRLPSFTHVLTHLDWRLHPLRWDLPSNVLREHVDAITATWPTGRWFSSEQALAAGLPAPLRKLIT